MVLAGWLGCRLQYLRRYEELYRKLGFEVLSYVASPRVVVGSTFQSIHIAPPKESNWPASVQLETTNLQQFEDMESLAWHVLGRIHNKQPHCFIYHGFSNGGCFLWEQILRTLQYYHDGKDNTVVSEILTSLRTRLNGVVFDSCPAWFGGEQSSLRLALKYCSWGEQLDILFRYGPGVILYDGKLETERRNSRCDEMFRTLHESSLDIPELYLYCENDVLTNFERVDKLVHYRQSLQRTRPVMNKVWKHSKHCTHLLMHPVDYEKEISMFAATCLRQSKL